MRVSTHLQDMALCRLRTALAVLRVVDLTAAVLRLAMRHVLVNAQPVMEAEHSEDES